MGINEPGTYKYMKHLLTYLLVGTVPMLCIKSRFFITLTEKYTTSRIRKLINGSRR